MEKYGKNTRLPKPPWKQPKIVLKGTSRAIGKSVSTGLGLVAGVGIDMLLEIQLMRLGKEITNTAATGGLFALTEGGSAALATAGISNQLVFRDLRNSCYWDWYIICKWMAREASSRGEKIWG